ncbi:transposase [Salmonella enterica subsp. enterica serovar Enteritidis]|nr:transposase [Salmonella enterica subsp. enterica serovar Enteritidis]
MSNANEVRIRRKRFTHEFRQECVNLVLQHKYPVTQAAETMNIGLSTLQRWLRQYHVKSGGTVTEIASITPGSVRWTCVSRSCMKGHTSRPSLRPEGALLNKSELADRISTIDTPVMCSGRCAASPTTSSGLAL